MTKDAIQQSNSNYAQGGIAGVLDPEDKFEEHIADTLVAGGTLLAALAAAMLATSLFFPSREALAASKLRAAAQSGS